MTKTRNILISAIVVLCVIISLMVVLVIRISASAETYSEANKKIVIDAGHGGFDPGATGLAGTIESEINLQIAMRLKEIFLRDGFDVIMVREEEKALAGKKKEDMAARRKIIEESGASAVISIHQNSYKQDQSCKGPQVFYAKGSEQGRILADYAQQELNVVAGMQKTRLSKDSNFYIVESGDYPAILVECGFLSNSEDEQRLNQPQYQLKIAKAIAQAVCSYLDEYGGNE